MADKRLNLIVDLINKTEKGFKQVYSDLEAIEKRTESTSRYMREMGAIGTATFAALGLATKKFLSDAGELEQQTIAFETMLGSAEKAKDMLEDLSAFAAKTPFELQGIRGTAKQLMAMGIEQDKLIPTMKALGDVSAGLSVDLDRIAYNYGQVKTQTKLTGVELKDFMRAGIPLLGALSDVLGKSETEIKEMVSAGQIGFPVVEEAFRRMTSEGGQFQDLMFKQSASLNGQISNLKDNLTKMSEVIGTALLPVAKEITAKFIEITQKITAWVSENPRLAATIITIGLTVSALLVVLGLLGLALPRIVLGIGYVGKAFTVLKGIMLTQISITGIYATVTGALTTAFKTAKAATLLFAMSLNTLRGMMMATGIGAVIVLAGFLITKFLELKDTVGGFGNAFKFVWLTVKQTFYDSMAAILQGLDDLFSKIPGMSDIISDETIAGFKIMSEETGASMTDIMASVQSVGDTAGLTAEEVADAGADMGGTFELLTDDSEAAADAAEAYFKSLVESVGEIRDEIRTAYDDIAKSTADFQKSMGQEQVSYEEKVVNAVAEAYEKKKELERDLKKAKREDDPSDSEIERLQEQISEQEEIISSYKDLEIDLENQVAERRKYLRANEIEQMTMDHEKRLLMLKKEYLEEQVKSLQKIVVLNTEHAAILALLDAETRHKLEKELEQEAGFRTKLANQKQGLTTWMSETKVLYDNYVRDVQKKLEGISAGGKVKVSFSGASGARAQGGPVQPGRTFLVGEKGPELFTPETYGRIHANGSGGGLTVVFTANHFTDDRYAEQITKKIVQDFKRVAKISI